MNIKIFLFIAISSLAACSASDINQSYLSNTQLSDSISWVASSQESISYEFTLPLKTDSLLSYYQAHGTDWTESKFNEIKLELSSPTDSSIDFVENIYLYTNYHGQDTLIAYVESISSSNFTSKSLNLVDIDLNDSLLNESMQMTLICDYDTAFDIDYKVQIDASWYHSTTEIE